MENKGIIYVASSTTDRELRSFDLTKRRGIRPDLEKAIEFFRDRIQSRYLDQIHMLNNAGEGVISNGFASMAICCLLIDTFYQFEHGLAKTVQNEVNYTEFLRTYLGDVFDTQEKADRFYTDIRCGILHSAQTKNGSKLSTAAGCAVQYIDATPGLPIIVDVRKMEERLLVYFHEYCERIRYDHTTQSNFVKKLRKMF